ncbi:S8 family serine peptidase [Bacillus sp. sid0103]|uniref:S8 family serine peptidase n=1 Tax=Bacillus sp. sid0103 TaxID=2856337 RepID=UPI001C4602F1|nr:S8 family serine peptidase [Bacillus sp. sid0103]MBV7505699.1 S8 family serine peptidase [Bacillus sp. sid0103]
MKYIWSLSLMVLSLLFMSFDANADGINAHPKKIDPYVLFKEKSEYVAAELIVKFAPGTSQTEREDLLKQVDVIEETRLDDQDFSLVKVTQGAKLAEIAKRLLMSKKVLLVEPNYKYKKTYVPKEPSYSRQWYLNKLQLPKAWDKTKGSSKITVAVIDGGVQKDHPDLKGKIVSPYNAVTGSSSYYPDEHATHVAGIIAASFNKYGIAGISPDVKIMPINVFQGNEASAETVIRGIYYAVAHHADIINMSLGDDNYSHLLEAATKYAKSKGVVLVAAAGNSSTYLPMYPAASEGVIGVSATDRNDRIASFSNYGKNIDLAAPGVDIYSTVAGSTYAAFDGTSMAAPMVSGIAALVRSKNPFLSPSQVEAILKSSTVDLGSKGWDEDFGYGRIDAYKAVSKTAAPISTITAPKTYTMTGKNKAAFSFKTTSKTKVSLSIKDAHGKTIRKILSNKSSSGAKISASWDGKTASKKFVSTGTYKVEVKITKGSDSLKKSTTIKVINHTKPAIMVSGTTYTYSPKVSSKVTIPYELTQKVKVSAVVTDQSGKTVKKILSKKSKSAGKHSLVWNGKTTKGHLVKDGTYQIVMSFTDSHDKQGKPKKIQLKVDSVRPTGELSLSSTLFKMDNKTTSIIRVKLKESSTMIVHVVNEKGTIIKKLINKQANPGIISASWNGKNDKNQLVPEGTYHYFVQLKDKAGNITKFNSTSIILQDWRVPSISSGKDYYLKTKGSLTIDYNISKPGKVTIGIYQNGKPVTTIKSDAAELAGQHTFTWDGTDQAKSLLNDGVYQYNIKVVDKYNLTQTYSGNVHVEINKIEISYPAVIMFYPGEGSEVHYKLSRAAHVTIEIYNQSNQKIKTIVQDKTVNEGSQYFKWLSGDENDDTYYYVITAKNAYGQKSVKGKMTSTGNPAWLVSHSFGFHLASDQIYNDQLLLKINTKQQVTATVHVYPDAGSSQIAEKQYTVKSGSSTIVYTKLSKYSWYYYLIEYRDSLGNEYWYEINE